MTQNRIPSNIEAAKARVSQLMTIVNSSLSRVRAIDVLIQVSTRGDTNSKDPEYVTIPRQALDVLEEATGSLGTELTTLRDYYSSQLEGMENMTAVADEVIDEKQREHKEAVAQATAPAVALVDDTESKAERLIRRPARPSSTLAAPAPISLARTAAPKETDKAAKPESKSTLPTRAVLPTPAPYKAPAPTPPAQTSPHAVFDSKEDSPLYQELVKFNEGQPSLFSEFNTYNEVDIGLLDISEWIYLEEGFYHAPGNEDVCNAIIRFDGFAINWYIANNAIRIFHMELNKDATEKEGFRHAWPSHRQLTSSYLSSILQQVRARQGK